MRAFKRVTVVGALALVLAAGPAVAQAAPPQNPPAQPPTGQPPTGQPPTGQPPTGQPPTGQPPTGQKPVTPAPPAPAPAPRPFPEGAKFAYIELQRIAAMSAEGKAAATKIQEYEKKKLSEIQEKSKALEDMRKKLETQASVMSDAARAQLEKDIDRGTRELQFMQQNAQAERDQLERELNNEFQRKLNPIIEAISKEKGLLMLFSIRDNGAVWADTGLDLTEEVIKRFDAAGSAPAKK